MARQKLVGIILFLAILAYSNTFYGEFQFDDDIAILLKEQIKSLSQFFKSNLLISWTHGGRPVTDLTFALNYYIGDVNVLGYHIFNLIIHIINGLLIYYLVFLTMNSPAVPEVNRKNAFGISVLSSAIFLLHPIQTEAVSYISQRYESLASLFYLLSLIAYIKARLLQQSVTSGDSPRRAVSTQLYPTPCILYAISVVSGILAIGSKEIAVTIPVVILLYEVYFLDGEPVLKRIAVPGVFIILAFIAGIFILSGFNKSIDAGFSVKDFTPWEYLMTQFRVITTYIRLVFLPINQNLDYDFRISRSLFEADTFLSLIFLLGLIVTAILVFKRWRVGSFFILWFFIILSPTSSIIPIIDPIFEHRVYLASAGIFIIAADMLSRLPLSLKEKSIYNKISVLVVIILLLLIAGTTFQRNRVWQTRLSLWEDIARKSPMKARAHNNLGNCYFVLGRYFEAIESYKKAAALAEHNMGIHFNLAVSLDMAGLIDEALFYYEYFYSAAPPSAIAQKEDVKRRIESIKLLRSSK